MLEDILDISYDLDFNYVNNYKEQLLINRSRVVFKCNNNYKTIKTLIKSKTINNFLYESGIYCIWKGSTIEYIGESHGEESCGRIRLYRFAKGTLGWNGPSESHRGADIFKKRYPDRTLENLFVSFAKIPDFIKEQYSNRNNKYLEQHLKNIERYLINDLQPPCNK